MLRQLRSYDGAEKRAGDFGQGVVRDGCKALLLWVLEGEGHADAAFPFSLPHLQFAHRCLQAHQQAKPWVCQPRSTPERRALDYLDRRVARLKRDPRFATTVDELDSRWTAFCELREVLRLTNAELPRGDRRSSPQELPAIELLRLQQIKQAVDQYTAELHHRVPEQDKQSPRPTSAAGIILRYLRQYGQHLFGHPVRFDEKGHVVSVVERTNNTAEHFFGGLKQQLRRRVGRGQLGRDLEKQPAQVALVANLRSDEYVQLLSGSLNNLAAAFHQLDEDCSVEITLPARDHRNSELHKVLGLLLASEQPSPTERIHKLESRQPQHLFVPSADEIAAKTQQLKTYSDEQIHASTLIEIAQRPAAPPKPRDLRLPPPGAVLERRCGRRAYHVHVLDDGFIWGSNTYSTLTEVVRAITGNPKSGFDFFGLNIPWEQRASKLNGRRINRSTMIDLPIATEF